MVVAVTKLVAAPSSSCQLGAVSEVVVAVRTGDCGLTKPPEFSTVPGTNHNNTRERRRQAHASPRPCPHHPPPLLTDEQVHSVGIKTRELKRR